MNSWKVILATFVFYGAGVMTGSLIVNHVDYSPPQNPRHADAPAVSGNSTSRTNGQTTTRPPRLPEMLSKQFLQRLDEELRLAPDQREAIQKIITDSQNLMHKTMQDARLEIREQLTPEQRSKFDELVKRPPRHSPNSTNAPPANVPAAVPTNAPGV